MQRQSPEEQAEIIARAYGDMIIRGRGFVRYFEGQLEYVPYGVAQLDIPVVPAPEVIDNPEGKNTP